MAINNYIYNQKIKYRINSNSGARMDGLYSESNTSVIFGSVSNSTKGLKITNTDVIVGDISGSSEIPTLNNTYSIKTMCSRINTLGTHNQYTTYTPFTNGIRNNVKSGNTGTSGGGHCFIFRNGTAMGYTYLGGSAPAGTVTINGGAPPAQNNNSGEGGGVGVGFLAGTQIGVEVYKKNNNTLQEQCGASPTGYTLIAPFFYPVRYTG